MKNKYIITIIIFVILLLIAGFVFLNSQKNQYENMPGYTIHYYESYFVYDIETLENRIGVRKSEVVQCIQAPCDPHEIAIFTVKYNNTYLRFFSEIFKETEEKEITLLEKDLNTNQKKIIHKIINE